MFVSSEQNNRKLISLHNNGEDDKHAYVIKFVSDLQQVCGFLHQ
jgi:hypothetical protein